MQMLIEEMGLADTVDPMGGSWYVETLTNEMRGMMEGVMKEVDEAAASCKLVAKGIIQDKVSEQAYQRQLAVESGASARSGQLLPACRRGTGGRADDPTTRPRPAVRSLRSHEVRASRDGAAAAKALKGRRRSARRKATSCPP